MLFGLITALVLSAGFSLDFDKEMGNSLLSRPEQTSKNFLKCLSVADFSVESNRQCHATHKCAIDARHIA